MKAEGAAPAKDQEGKADIESQICTIPRHQPQLKETQSVHMHSHEEFLPVQLFQLQITPDGTLTPVCRIGPALALPQRQVSSAIKCNVG